MPVRLRFVRTVMDNAKPSKFGLPMHRPSLAMIWVSPTRKFACITLFSEPGEAHAGLRWLRDCL